MAGGSEQGGKGRSAEEGGPDGAAQKGSSVQRAESPSSAGSSGDGAGGSGAGRSKVVAGVGSGLRREVRAQGGASSAASLGPLAEEGPGGEGEGEGEASASSSPSLARSRSAPGQLLGSGQSIAQSNHSLHSQYTREARVTRERLLDPATTSFLDLEPQDVRVRRAVVRRKLNSLHAAVFDRNALKLSLLLGEPKRDINKLDSFHRFSALHLAIDLGYSDIARLLLTGKGGDATIGTGGKRAAVDVRDLEERTPLHLAVLRGNAEIVELLALSAAPLDAQDCLGCTPLHYAMLLGNEAAITLLLDFGMRLGVIDNSGCVSLSLSHSLPRRTQQPNPHVCSRFATHARRHSNEEKDARSCTTPCVLGRRSWRFACWPWGTRPLLWTRSRPPSSSPPCRPTCRPWRSACLSSA
jgi:hypothetical protein